MWVVYGNTHTHTKWSIQWTEWVWWASHLAKKKKIQIHITQYLFKFCYILVNISIPIINNLQIVSSAWKTILLSIRDTEKPLMVNSNGNENSPHTSNTSWQQKIKSIVLSGWLHYYRLQLVGKSLDLFLVSLLTLVGLLGECGINNNNNTIRPTLMSITIRDHTPLSLPLIPG